MISLIGATKTQFDAVPTAPSTSSERRSNAEMDRLREIILGETTERVDDISRQVTSRDARVRRLIEDMPDALNKNSTDQGALTRLADALRIPIEEALNQSVRGDQQKLADILAPALARALPRTLTAFFIGLPRALARRAFHVICPWVGRNLNRTRSLSGLDGAGAEQAFQVDRVCLFQKTTMDVLRTSDVGFDESATTLEVDHLFLQLADALRNGSPNPTATLRYPRPTSKNEMQGILVLESEHTILAAYHKGQPSSWLRDRLQDLTDEADALANAIVAESAAGESVEQRLQTLDALLKKGLVCYVPAKQPALDKTTVQNKNPWWEDAAVIACVIAVVWLVATVSRATTQWNQIVDELDKEAGIVVTDHSWMPGRSITGLRDPLAPDPTTLLTAHGYKSDSIKLHFTSFLSDEAPFKEQRLSLQHAERDSVRREISSSYARTLALMEASLEMHSAPATTAENAPAQPVNEGREVIRKELLRTMLELPANINFEFKNGTVTIPISLPKATRSHIREVIKAIPWVKELNEATLPAGTSSTLPNISLPIADAGNVIQSVR